MPAAVSPRLDRAVILDAARRLVEREGPEGITMRRLGTELGADPTAVYRHFRSKDAIVSALTAMMFDEVSSAYRPTNDWRHDLRWVMTAVYRVYVTNVALATSLAREPWESSAQQDGSELVLDVLHRAGLRGPELAMTHHVAMTAMAGAGVYNAYEPKVDAAERRRLQRAYRALPPTTHPRLTDAADDLFPDPEQVFAALVDAIVISIEARTDGSRHDYGSPTDEEVHLA